MCGTAAQACSIHQKLAIAISRNALHTVWIQYQSALRPRLISEAMCASTLATPRP